MPKLTDRVADEPRDEPDENPDSNPWDDLAPPYPLEPSAPASLAEADSKPKRNQKPGREKPKNLLKEAAKAAREDRTDLVTDSEAPDQNWEG